MGASGSRDKDHGGGLGHVHARIMGASFSLDPDADADRFRRSWSTTHAGRLRLLCLHGWGANNDITRLQVTNLGLEDKHAVSCDLIQAVVEVRSALTYVTHRTALAH